MKRRFERRGVLALAASAFGLLFEVTAGRSEPFEQIDDAAVVDVRGPLVHENDFWCDSYDNLVERVLAAMSSSSSRVVLRIDSPGGDAIGCIETARTIRAIADRFGKPLHAFVDGMACSAAYGLACACDSISALPSAFVGSIGCIDALVDAVAADREQGLNFAVVTSGKRKSDGCPHVPITDDAVAAAQRRVDALAGMFAGWVAERRGAQLDDVLALDAGIFVASDATGGVRLVDETATTFEEFLAMVASGSTTARANASAEDPMTLKEMVAALTKMAEGDGEDADMAKKMLASMDDGEKKDDGAKSEAEPDGDEPKKKDEPASEVEPDGDEAPKKKDDAPSSATAAVPPKLVALEKRVSAIETEKERVKLLASRPDLMADAKMKAWLSIAPLATVKNAIASIPKPAVPKPAAAAASNVVPIRAEGQQDGARTNHSPPEVIAELDARMGLAPQAAVVQRVGKALVFAPMTREEARAALAKKEGAK